MCFGKTQARVRQGEHQELELCLLSKQVRDEVYPSGVGAVMREERYEVDLSFTSFVCVSYEYPAARGIPIFGRMC